MATKKQLEEEILSVLKEIKKEREEFSLISHEEHDFLRELIEEHRERKETWRTIKIRVLTGTVWTAAGGVAYACVIAIKQWLTV